MPLFATTDARLYERKRKTEQHRQAVHSAAGRDIGPTPDIANPKRRKRCERSLKRFCEVYNQATFCWPWSPDLLDVIETIEQSVVHGGLSAIALPRGGGKSSLCRMAVLWATSYGHVLYVYMIGANALRAGENLEAIKIWMRTLEPYGEDFPEITRATRYVRGQANRAQGMQCNGQETFFRWEQERIVLPRVPPPPNSGEASPWAKTSGIVIGTSGLTGEGIRGSLYAHPDGRSVRPDLVLLDDPQTDESAASPLQNDTRFRLITGAVLGMAGPGKQIAAVMPCTVIRPGDMADKVLNRKENPLWRGIRRKMLTAMPADMAAWEPYFEVFRSCMGQAKPDIRPANKYYRKHRKELDAGAVPTWKSRRLSDEVSPVQHAMDLYCRLGRAAFMAEYQNDPEDERAANAKITAAMVARKTNGLARGIIPKSAEFVSAYIDVHGRVLYYVVTAWSNPLAGSVINYGTYPRQPVTYFSQASAPVGMDDLATQQGGLTEEARLLAGLQTLTDALLAGVYRREDGAEMAIGQILIDARWGQQNELVKQFCRRQTHGGRVLAAQGYGSGTRKPPLRTLPLKPGTRDGTYWRIAPPTAGNRWVTIDANAAKTLCANRLAMPLGTYGGIDLFGTEPQEHALFADHCVSEAPEEITATGLTYEVWNWLLPHLDNHYWDCYDNDTDVLAEDGWKRFSDLTGSEKLATVNLASDLIEYQVPTHIIHRSYVGNMVRIGGLPRSRVDLLVTPGHRMVIYAGQASRGPVVRAAEELTIWDKIKTTATWVGDDTPFRVLPASGYYPRVSVRTSDLAAFMGWYVSEGWSGHIRGTYRTIISQDPGEKRKAICTILSRLPWKFHEVPSGVVLSNQQVFDLVSGLGKSRSKRVPQWIKAASPNVIREFIRCAVDGDGWHDGKHEAYATTSPGLADDMQELYLKAGYGASLYIRPPKPYFIKGRRGDNTVDQFHVHRKLTRWALLRDWRNRPNFRTVSHKGTVHCATVPNGTLIVRRGGKVAICGNCLVGSMIAGMIQGACVEGMDRTAARPKLVSMAELAGRARRGT